MKPAIFLDRDGVLCENRPDYVKNEEELRLFPWTTLAMRTLAQLDAYIFVFTNQSAVGRGILSLQEAENINKRLKYLIELGGGRIDDIFMCPHTPKDNCGCRKPNTGMVLRAWVNNQDLDPDNITIVGDQFSDLVEITRHEIKYFLVQSGLTKELPRRLWGKVSFVPTLLEVAKWLNVHKPNSTAKTVVLS